MPDYDPKFHQWYQKKFKEFSIWLDSVPKKERTSFNDWLIHLFYESNANHNFYQGFAMAISSLIKTMDLPTVAADVMHGNEISIKDFKDAKIHKYDLDIITKAFKKDPSLYRKTK